MLRRVVTGAHCSAAADASIYVSAIVHARVRAIMLRLPRWRVRGWQYEACVQFVLHGCDECKYSRLAPSCSARDARFGRLPELAASKTLGRTKPSSLCKRPLRCASSIFIEHRYGIAALTPSPLW